MERIIRNIFKNSEQLKDEFDAVQTQLINILERNGEAIKDIGSLSDKDLNKKYLLNLLEFQYSAIQKLAEVGLELDEFTKQTSPNSVDNLSNFTSKSELSLIAPSTFMCDGYIPSKPSTPNEELANVFVLCDAYTKKPQAPILESNSNNVKESNKELNSMTLIDNIEISNTPCLSSNEEISKSSTLHSEENKSAPLHSEELNKPSPLHAEELNKSSTSSNEEVSKSAAVPKEEPNESPTVVVINEKKNEENGIESSDSLSESDKDDDKKSSADVSSSEEVSQRGTKTKTIQEKLKAKKLMTRRDRYLQNIERPDVPDLSFKPSNKVLESTESYITCPESSSSTSAIQLKERRKKKRRNTDKGEMTPCETDAICYKKPREPHINMLCLVSRAASPSEFYINHLDENIGLVDTLSIQLAEIYKDTSSPFLNKNTAMSVLGKNCVCYIESYSSWYRVIVTNWRLKAREYQEDLVTVFLVDYGHACTTTYKNLRELSEEFCQIPICAIKCHLAWLYPPKSTEENLLDVWPQQSLEYFMELFSDQEHSVYKVVYAEKCGDSWGIDVIKNDEKGETNTFGQLMIDNGMAVEIFQDPKTLFKNDFFRKQVATAQGLAGISSQMDNGEKIEKFHENTGNKEFNNIDQAMLSYRATDEARTCSHARNGTCFKGKRCKLDHGKLRPDGYTTDKQSIYVSAFKQLEMPTTDSVVQLQITNILTVNTFYACLINGECQGFRNLIKTMNKSETIAKYKPLEILPACGEIVIAKNWNNYWYRAQVMDVFHYPQKEEETAKVFLVDLGETVDTKMSDLRTIVREFLYIPFQAIYCRLYNVKPKQDQDQTEAKSYCERSFLCQICTAEVKYASHSTLEVLLKKDNSQDIGEQIIEEGFGELRTDHIFPSETLLVD